MMTLNFLLTSCLLPLTSASGDRKKNFQVGVLSESAGMRLHPAVFLCERFL